MNAVVELREVPEAFERWLAGRPLAERSRREYGRNVRAYCAWLAVTSNGMGGRATRCSGPLARDPAARDYRRFLQVERRAAASTVNCPPVASVTTSSACDEGDRAPQS